MNPRIDEIVLLTHEWESMRAWWGALLGVDPRTVGHRTAVLETPGLRVVIEHSDIAMNANPEVAGVISLTVAAPSAIAALETHQRLIAIGSRHHRATNDVSGVCLWYRDPNGTDVAIRLPIEADANNRRGQEINPDHIVTRLQAAAESTKSESISSNELHARGK
jgi:catechol-2,3-dioxygenase